MASGATTSIEMSLTADASSNSGYKKGKDSNSINVKAPIIANKSAFEFVNDNSENNNKVIQLGGVQTVAYDVLEQTNSGIVIGDQLAISYGGNNINFGDGSNVQGITSMSVNTGGNAVNTASKVITNVSNNIGNPNVNIPEVVPAQ
jgi:hypothetical protein